MADRGKVLIVDDEPYALRVLSAILSEEGYSVLEASSAGEAIKTMSAWDIDAIITDMRMPGMDGVQLFEHVKEHFPDVPVIFLTAYGSVESAVSAMTGGAFNYFIKPPDYPKLKEALSRAVEQRRLKREIEILKRRLSGGEVPPILGHSPGMLKIMKTISTVRDSESSVLIYGETGTGKELVARALHFSSARREKPFIAVNCAAIPRELMESELFGYEKGAFTGAVSRRVGKFEGASGGTVFLDEIGELDPSLQAKLLRVLEEREIERLGSNTKIKVDFRLVSSTNRDLEKEVAEGRFREDLFYRVNVIKINIPPLRERKDDLPLLTSEFVREFSARENRTANVSEQAMRILEGYHWPGNIRQLRNVIERAVVIAKNGTITARELPEELLLHSKRSERQDSVRPLRDMELEAVTEALGKCRGNKSRAAKMLGISRKALYKRLKLIGESAPGGRMSLSETTAVRNKPRNS